MAHDELRQHLLRQTSPPVTTPMDALRLMNSLMAESYELRMQTLRGETDPDAVAGHHRRLAYVLVHLAEHHPEFREEAENALARWSDAEAAAITDAVERRTTR
ncbi:hypothetical protein [Kitasatospora sp. NPDC127116]|uniref:hypothetical protein n=1 Tax=Kitasatospora sp. NPDC127116 TaxID=3345367 RepID=UPI00362F8EA2